MKNLFLAVLLMFGLTVIKTSAQTKKQIVKTYIDQNKTEGMMRLNHKPFFAKFDDNRNAILFFVFNYDLEREEYNNYGILYDKATISVTKFGFNNIQPEFGNGVISVFFENVDTDAENELIVLYEGGYRSHFVDGPYAGHKVWYQTRVFDMEKKMKCNVLTEYKVIGELLTVNCPAHMGTMKEEYLIGREESSELEKILGVTSNAEKIKSRITLLRSHGLLGGNLKKDK